MKVSIQKSLLYLLKKSGIFIFFLIMTIIGTKITFSPQYGDRWFIIFPLLFSFGMLCYSIIPHLNTIKAIFTKNIHLLETEITEKSSGIKETYGYKEEITSYKLKNTDLIFQTENSPKYDIGDKISLWYIINKNGDKKIIKDEKIFIYSNSVEIPESEFFIKCKQYIILSFNKTKEFFVFCKNKTVKMINLLKFKLNRKKGEL